MPEQSRQVSTCHYGCMASMMRGEAGVKEYVEERNGGLYVIGTRISLDSVVIMFLQGASPDWILYNYPGLKSLENIYGVITFYFANKGMVDHYLEEQEKAWQEAARQAEPLPMAWRERWERLKREKVEVE